MTQEQPFGLLRRWEVALAASRDQRVPRAALAVFMAILDRLNNESGDAWPSLSRIAADTGISRRSVVSSVAALVDLGYLERQSGDRKIANVYRLAREASFPREAHCPREADFPGGREISGIEVGKPASLQPTHKTYPIEPTHPTRERALSVDALFAEFWTAYPRKEAKGAARKAFAKRKPDRALLDRMLAAIGAQQEGDQWQRGFIPHPATWLNQERWLDELIGPIGPTHLTGESLADRAARQHDQERRSWAGNVVEGEFRTVASTSGKLPRETDADAINAAGLARLGIKP